MGRTRDNLRLSGAGYSWHDIEEMPLMRRFALLDRLGADELRKQKIDQADYYHGLTLALMGGMADAGDLMKKFLDQEQKSRQEAVWIEEFYWAKTYSPNRPAQAFRIQQLVEVDAQLERARQEYDAWEASGAAPFMLLLEPDGREPDGDGITLGEVVEEWAAEE